MKIRTGFVSNSSSSSFCIFGVDIEEEKFIDKLQKVFKTKTKKDSCSCEEDCDSEDCCGEDNTSELVEELTSKIEKKYNLEVFNMGFDSSLYVGKSWKNIKGDQTGDQFKEEIKKDIEELFGIKKCATHQEAWSDG